MKIDSRATSFFKPSPKEADKGKEEKLQSACRELEAFFMQKMMSIMRESAPRTDLFGSTQARDTFQSLLDAETAKKLSASGGFGLGDVLYRQLSRR